MRPKRARFAHSIGHRPMYKALVYSPCKGKSSNNALKINAFALWLSLRPPTSSTFRANILAHQSQGDALGYELLGFGFPFGRRPLRRSARLSRNCESSFSTQKLPPSGEKHINEVPLPLASHLRGKHLMLPVMCMDD